MLAAGRVRSKKKERKKKNEFLPHPKHPRLKNYFFSSGNSLLLTFKAAATLKGDMFDMPSVQPTEQSRTSPPGSRGSEYMPQHPSCGCLPESSVSRAIAVLSKLEKKY